MGNLQTKRTSNSSRIPVQPKTSSANISILGAGSCGKTTIFRQFRLLYGTLDKEPYVHIILDNIVHTIKNLVIYCREREIGFESQENTKAAEKLMSFLHSIDMVAKLWNDKNIQLHYFDAYREMHLSDGVTHLFENIDRIISSQYTPTIEDVMACEVRTIGFDHLNFSFDNINFRVTNPGGKRNERKKWIHVFEHATVLIYVAALNDILLLCSEDVTTNRLVENLNLFEEIINSKWFIDIPVILLLTKPDILLNALESGIKLNKYFPEYMGDNDFEDVSFWIYEQFMNRCKTKDKKSITTFILNANQTKETEVLFSHVIEITKDTLFNTQTYKGYGKVHNLFDPTGLHSLGRMRKNLLQLLCAGDLHDTLFNHST